MGLFDKKYCDICGEKISLLGIRKLDDGNMCSSCAKLISPFMTDRRKTSVSDMKEHLAYREANKQRLKNFNISQTFGDGQKVYIDSMNRCFIVTYDSPDNFEKENPDIIPMSELVSCNLEIKENRKEEFTKDAQGNRVSFNPPRYKFDYDFYIHIALSGRWFNEIEIKLNTFDVEGLNSQRYHNYEMMAQQIINGLTGNTANYTYGGGYGAGAQFGGGAGTVGGMFSSFVNQVQQNAYNAGTPQPSQQYSDTVTEEQIRQIKQQGLEAMQTKGIQQTSQRICPKCSTLTEGNFCPACGSETVGNTTRIICSGCGNSIEMNGIIPKFCPACGNKINIDDIVM